jgi:hypothetical protein
LVPFAPATTRKLFRAYAKIKQIESKFSPEKCDHPNPRIRLFVVNRAVTRMTLLLDSGNLHSVHLTTVNPHPVHLTRHADHTGTSRYRAPADFESCADTFSGWHRFSRTTVRGCVFSGSLSRRIAGSSAPGPMPPSPSTRAPWRDREGRPTCLGNEAAHRLV